MSMEFWAGVLLTTILGIPITIIGNLYSEQVRDYLNRRKVFRLNKKRELELQTYRKVLRLIEGEPRQTLLFDEERHTISLGTFSAFTMSAGVFVFAYYREPIVLIVSKFVAVGLVIVASLFAAFVSFAVLIAYQSHLRTIQKVRNFSEYQAQIRAKWGDDVI